MAIEAPRPTKRFVRRPAGTGGGGQSGYLMVGTFLPIAAGPDQLILGPALAFPRQWLEYD